MLDLAILGGAPNAQHAGLTAVGVRGRRIALIGDDATVRRHIGPGTRVIDARGGTILPGFTDCHVHMTHVSRYNGWACCENLDSMDALVAKLQSAAPLPSGWICGYNYHHRNLREKTHPTRHDLDRVSTSHPVAVSHSSGHFWVFNSVALERLQLPAHDDVALIERDSEGRPVGLFGEAAVAKYVYPALGFYDARDLPAAYAATCRSLNQLGLTTVHHIEVESRDELLAWQALRRSGDLSLRIRFVATEGMIKEVLESGFASGFGDSWLRLGFLKLYIDGSVMGGTAALAEPYEHIPNSRGELRTSAEDARAWVRWAHRDGYQFTAHVMGEWATDVFLDAVEEAQTEFPRPDPRHRLEHISLATPEQLARIRRLGMHASVQPSICQCHVYGSFGDILSTIGTRRARRINDFRAMADAGLLLAGGSDAPSGTINPIAGLHCAVNYEFDPRGREKALTLEEAVAAFTTNGPWSTREEHELGRLSPGYLADIAVLSGDLYRIPHQEILSLSVTHTVVDGRVVYEA